MALLPRKRKIPKEPPLLISQFQGDRLGKWCIALGITVVSVSVFTLIASMLQLYVVDALVHQRVLSAGLTAFSDAAGQITGYTGLAVSVLFFICFLLWFRCMYANLQLLNYNTYYKHGWAIGSFFVPFLNFVRPYQIARELIDHSDRKNNPVTKNDSLVLRAWWTFYLVSSLLGALVFRTAPKEGSPAEDYVSYSWMFLITNGIDPICYVLFLLFIFKVIEKQRRARVEQQEQNSAFHPDPEGSH